MNENRAKNSEQIFLSSGNTLQVIAMVIVTIALFLIFIFAVLLPDYRYSLMERKRDTIREATLSVYSLLTNYENDVQNGRLSLDEAQNNAIRRIRELRYGYDMKDYFWINDLRPVMIMHPYRSELEGEDLSTFSDIEGTYLFNNAVAIVSREGEGYIEYMWQWQDNPSRIEKKVSFVKGFTSWGWIIGSGMYIDDVNREITAITRKAQLISIIISFMMMVSMVALVRINIIANKSKKEIEDFRRKSEERFRTVVNSSKDAMVAINTYGLITLFNPAAETVFGYDHSEVVGKSLDIMLPEHFREKHRTYVRDFFATGKPNTAIGQTIELPAIRKNGTDLTIDLSLSEGRFGDERFVLAVIRDITKRKELEERLQQSQKMESIGRLAGGVAHDFNNILTAILGNSELAMMSISSDDNLYSELEEIVDNAKRASLLTSQLLAFSRKQVSQPKTVDLNEIISNMSKMLQRLISENIEFTTHLEPDIWHVFIDPVQIEQVITNLVVNAHDAMPTGGRLIIETKNIVVNDEHEIGTIDMHAGNYVLLKVTDSGMGMNEITKSHLFEPFYTTKEKGKGTGLGLSTCYGIVKQSKGYIHVDSTEMVGTAISIFLPQSPEAQLSEKSTKVDNNITGGNETVLVVEDELSVKNMIVRTLAHAGYSVYDASNGEEALHLINDNMLQFDLLITDLVMPKMSGKELSDRVKTSLQNFKILFMSGYIDDTIGKENILQKGYHFISKPFSPFEIAKKVRDILDDRI